MLLTGPEPELLADTPELLDVVPEELPELDVEIPELLDVAPEELPELVLVPELLDVVPEELPELVLVPELLEMPPELLDATPTPELLPEELPELVVEVPELLDVPPELLLDVLPELLLGALPELLLDALPELLPEPLSSDEFESLEPHAVVSANRTLTAGAAIRYRLIQSSWSSYCYVPRMRVAQLREKWHVWRMVRFLPDRSQGVPASRRR